MAIPEFEKIEPISVASQVYDYLRQSILSGSLLPGTHLAEPQIATLMGVSRSPVREAFRQLEAQGLIEIRINQGAFVQGFSADKVHQVYTARSLIEGYTAGLAAQRAAPADIERLRQAVDAVDAAARREDFEGTIRADFALHKLIWQIADHGILYEVLARLDVQIRMFMVVQAPMFDHLYDSVAGHQRIVDAIAAGDAEATRSTMRAHIDEAGMLTMRKLRQVQDE